MHANILKDHQREARRITSCRPDCKRVFVHLLGQWAIFRSGLGIVLIGLTCLDIPCPTSPRDWLACFCSCQCISFTLSLSLALCCYLPLSLPLSLSLSLGVFVLVWLTVCLLVLSVHVTRVKSPHAVLRLPGCLLPARNADPGLVNLVMNKGAGAAKSEHGMLPISQLGPNPGSTVGRGGLPPTPA